MKRKIWQQSKPAYRPITLEEMEEVINVYRAVARRKQQREGSLPSGNQEAEKDSSAGKRPMNEEGDLKKHRRGGKDEA